MMSVTKFRLLLSSCSFRSYSSIKRKLDFSFVPALKEQDLEEQHVKGSGPGGSKISTTCSCVVLKHLPSERNNYITSQDSAMFIRNYRLFQLLFSFRRYYSIKSKLDYSLVPTLKEQDLEEQFVKGSGPGGQKINKTSSCVVLKHLPSGIVIKCQESRSLDANRKKARELLVNKLDIHLNGENSIEAQRKRLLSKKSYSNEYRREKLRQLKEKWKESENME